MTHALVVVDRRFLNIDGTWYTPSALGPDSGDAYLQYFDRITVAGRAGDPTGFDVARLSKPDARLTIHCLPNLSSMRAQLTLRSKVRLQLLALMDEVDAVIVRIPTELGYVAAELAQMQGLPLAGDIGACAHDGALAHGSLSARLYAPWRYRRARRAAERCDYLHYVTQEYLQERYPSKPGSVVLAASDVTIAQPDPAVLRSRLNNISQKRDPLVFGTVGSLVGKLKGIHLAIEALGRLRQDLPPFEYRVLGGGDPSPLRALAERHGIGDRVIFDGLRPGGQPVLDWLDGVDVYLQPSLREGLARATIEAMSRGCPAIVSDIAGMPELLDAPERIMPGSVPALMSVLRGTFDPDWQRSQAERNWHRAQEYSMMALAPRRDAFWTSFAQAAQERTRTT